MKKALITGITGQDGSYLAELLLSKNYQVHGVVRRSSTENFERIHHIAGSVKLHQADLLDQSSLTEVLRVRFIRMKSTTWPPRTVRRVGSSRS